MKKILIVSPFFAPAYSYGGIVRVAYDHALGLVKKGFDVTVITTDVFDEKKRLSKLNEEMDGIKVIRFKNLDNKLAKFQNLYIPFGMRKWMKNNISQYDVVHIHDIYNLPTYWACKYALKNNIKYFIQPHGTLSDVRIKARKSKIKKIILKKLKKYFDKASGWFALTKTEIDEVKLVTDNKNIYELPNGLHLDKFKNVKAFDIHKEYNLAKDTKIISYLGRIQYIKGLDISLKILSKLNKTNKKWVYLVIGPDEGAKDSLVKLSKELGIEDKIIWYGLENTDKKYDLLAGSDLFLFPSRSEGFPMTILESLACSLPVLISTGCNVPSIGDKNGGITIDISNLDSIEEKLSELFKNKDKYIKLGHKLINEKYDINILILDLIKHYEKNNSNSSNN